MRSMRAKGGAVELHEWLMFFHVLGSIVWVGGVIVLYALSERATRSSDRTAISRATGQLEWVGQRLMGPSILVVVGLGIWLVILEEDITFSQLWIWLSLVLVVASALPGIYSGPEGKRVASLAEERGADDGEVRRRANRLLWLARVDILILVAVLWLMVFKPGGPSG
jgi:uncharacterized membrane protein